MDLTAGTCTFGLAALRLGGKVVLVDKDGACVAAGFDRLMRRLGMLVSTHGADYNPLATTVPTNLIYDQVVAASQALNDMGFDAWGVANLSTQQDPEAPGHSWCYHFPAMLNEEGDPMTREEYAALSLKEVAHKQGFYIDQSKLLMDFKSDAINGLHCDEGNSFKKGDVVAYYYGSILSEITTEQGNSGWIIQGKLQARRGSPANIRARNADTAKRTTALNKNNARGAMQVTAEPNIEFDGPHHEFYCDPWPTCPARMINSAQGTDALANVKFYDNPQYDVNNMSSFIVVKATCRIKEGEELLVASYGPMYSAAEGGDQDFQQVEWQNNMRRPIQRPTRAERLKKRSSTAKVVSDGVQSSESDESDSESDKEKQKKTKKAKKAKNKRTKRSVTTATKAKRTSRARTTGKRKRPPQSPSSSDGSNSE